MGIISDIYEKRSSLANPEKWFVDWLNQGNKSLTGINVDATTAMKYSAFFCGVRIISETNGSLPLILFKRLKNGGRERATNHNLYNLMHLSPNPQSTAMTFRSTLQNHLVTWGNAYAQIAHRQNKTIAGLYPLRPDRMTVKIDDNNLKIYEYKKNNFQKIIIPENEILHIPGFGYDGIVGYSILTLAREAIGMGLGVEEFGARYFGQGTNMGMIVSFPGKLNKESRLDYEKSINEAYSGLDASHKAMLLEGGVTVNKVGIPPEDSQFIETKKFSVIDIARFLNIPPHLLKDLDKATFSNIEQQSLEFVIYTMRSWFVLWEQWLNLKLLSESEREEYYFEFLVDALLRGDIKARYEAYRIGSDAGWWSADEIREKENMNPQPDGMGQIYNVPLNFQNKENWVNNNTNNNLNNDINNNSTREQRAVRSIKERNNIAESYKKVFNNTIGKIIGRESNAINRSAQKYLKDYNSIDFNLWIDKFYNDMPKYINEDMMPILLSYGEMIQSSAAEEVNYNYDKNSDEGLMLQFSQEYINNFIRFHIGTSKRQIKGLLLRQKKENWIDEINKVLDNWKDKRVNNIVNSQIVEANCAYTKRIYKNAGFNKIMWVNQDNNEYCKFLNGKVIDINNFFVLAGDELKPDEEHILKINKKLGHPPLFDGCGCSIIVGK